VRRRVGIRPTLLVFTADDPTARESAANTVRMPGNKRRYTGERYDDVPVDITVSSVNI
jgi:hypothetical protein